jgi:homogentisate 1,2-dioxygenase
LIKGRNNPQKCPFGLYAEQFSGTSFTQPRHKNLRSWLYRILPTAGHTNHAECDEKEFAYWVSDFDSNSKNFRVTPDQIRWKPFDLIEDSSKKVDFLHGIRTYCGVGSPAMKNGIGIYGYSCNISMDENSAFYSADGDFLIVPQEGELFIKTELGKLSVKPKEICVIPRGLRFNVAINKPSRGYICEVFKGHFILPDLGPIGSNSLASPRDFEVPVAYYEDKDCEFKMYVKYNSQFFTCKYEYSIFNVVAWWGNYVPYKYDLNKYNTIGSISFDHPDPSIFTVLTAGSDEPG